MGVRAGRCPAGFRGGGHRSGEPRGGLAQIHRTVNSARSLLSTGLSSRRVLARPPLPYLPPSCLLASRPPVRCSTFNTASTPSPHLLPVHHLRTLFPPGGRLIASLAPLPSPLVSSGAFFRINPLNQCFQQRSQVFDSNGVAPPCCTDGLLDVSAGIVFILPSS
jgi:hypothetical protein